MKIISIKRKWWLDKRSRIKNQRLSKCNLRTKTSRSIRLLRQSEVYTWKAPRIFDLSERITRSKLIVRIEDLKQMLSQAETSICLDFSNVEKFYADGVLLFWAELNRSIQKRTCGIQGITCIAPTNHKIAQVLKQIGFYDLIGSPQTVTPIDEDVINWRVAHGSKADGSKYEEVLGNFDGNIAAPLQEHLYTGITEAMTNVANHAYFLPRSGEQTLSKSKDWWMFSQYRQGTLTVSFVDLGSGIPVTLPSKNPSLWKKIKTFVKHGRRRDGAAIEFAIGDSISRTRLAHRGKGLGQIVSVIQSANNGAISIFSNYGRYARGQSYNYQDSIKGTMICWNMSIDGKEST
jgi:hypothetical protein